jgi:hypothetical protein
VVAIRCQHRRRPRSILQRMDPKSCLRKRASPRGQEISDDDRKPSLRCYASQPPRREPAVDDRPPRGLYRGPQPVGGQLDPVGSETALRTSAPGSGTRVALGLV